MTSMYFVFVIQRGLGKAVMPSFLPWDGGISSRLTDLIFLPPHQLDRYNPKLKFILVKILIPLFAIQSLIISFSYNVSHLSPSFLFLS